MHSMQWIDETHLYGMTDRGLVKWDIGHLSDGEKTLKYEAWRETCVAVPATVTRMLHTQSMVFE